MATPESKGFHKKKKPSLKEMIIQSFKQEFGVLPYQKAIAKKIGEQDAKKFAAARRAEKIGKQDVESFQEAIKKKAGGRL